MELKRSSLSPLYFGHLVRKWVSSSISWFVQLLHILSFLCILVYLPVSIKSLWTDVRNLQWIFYILIFSLMWDIFLIRCYDVLLLFFVSLSSLCFATDEDGCAVENFCNTLFKYIYNLHEEIFCLIVILIRLILGCKFFLWWNTLWGTLQW